VSYALHAKHRRATYVRGNITEAAHVLSTPYCDGLLGLNISSYRVAFSTKFGLGVALGTPFMIPKRHHVGGYHVINVYKLPTEHWDSASVLPILPTLLCLLEISIVITQTGVTASCTVLDDFPLSQHYPSVIHIGLRIPVIRGTERRRWNFRKTNWSSYTAATEHSIPLISLISTTMEEASRGLDEGCSLSYPPRVQTRTHSMYGC